MSSDPELHRQIHPSFIQNGDVGKNAFLPSESHEFRLSVYDGEQISPEDSFKHYTEQLGFQSGGVQTFTEEECNDVGLKADRDGMPFKEHVSIDFSELSAGAKRTAAKKLRQFAKVRGWQFGPTAEN